MVLVLPGLGIRYTRTRRLLHGSGELMPRVLQRTMVVAQQTHGPQAMNQGKPMGACRAKLGCVTVWGTEWELPQTAGVLHCMSGSQPRGVSGSNHLCCILQSTRHGCKSPNLVPQPRTLSQTWQLRRSCQVLGLFAAVAEGQKSLMLSLPTLTPNFPLTLVSSQGQRWYMLESPCPSIELTTDTAATTRTLRRSSPWFAQLIRRALPRARRHCPVC
jgi:hypothetical protein